MPTPRLLFLVNEIDRLLGDVVEVMVPDLGHAAEVSGNLDTIDSHIDELRTALTAPGGDSEGGKG